MKNLLIIFFLILCPVFLLAQDLTGGDIVKKMSDIMNQESASGKMKMTITTTSGQKRTFIYESFSADSGKSNVVIYREPTRVKGQATLLLNNADDIWGYYPRTDRVRKLATHAKKQKMQGSDFTYEDMGGGNAFVTDFDARRLADEETGDHDCYVIALTPNEKSNSKYARMVLWIIKKNFIPIMIDYYEEDDPKVAAKRLIQSDIKIIQGVATPMKIVMRNNLDDSETLMEIIEIKYNVEIDDARINPRSFYK